MAKVKYNGLVSGSYLDKMIDNGWELESADGENEEELASIMLEYYDNVKVYRTTTSVKGYYRVVALGKNDNDGH